MLSADFEKHGAAVIEEVRRGNPASGRTASLRAVGCPRSTVREALLKRAD
jgi:hypothetical protein